MRKKRSLVVFTVLKRGEKESRKAENYLWISISGVI
jgi:hypothetical protein